MSKRFLILLIVVFPLLHLAAPPTTAAQLKLDIKLFLGLGETTYVAKLETGRERNFFGSYQIGFGP